MNLFSAARTRFLMTMPLMLFFAHFLGQHCFAQQVTGQDLDTILERADKLVGEAKTAYEEARSKSSVSAFVDAGFKLEEARIKYLVLQEIGTPEKQKLASDRLRAVNQLNKLIHDGKVAIAGTPADAAPATAKSNDLAPPPNAAPDSQPKPPDAKAPADVTQRLSVPDTAKQRDAEKIVKDLFKDLYSKKAASDRVALAKALLEQVSKSSDDPVAVWVLYHEAQEASIQAGDPGLAVLVIERIARIFDVDSLALRNAALLSSAKVAKSPADFGSLAELLLKLQSEYVAVDQYENAERAVTAAQQHARRANDPALLNRATLRAKEVAEAKGRFQSLKGVLEALAKSPDNPNANLQMGQFLCFVKGNWDLGTRFLLNGSDASLKALAQKEIAHSIEVSEIIALADAWLELSEKDKSPLKKSQIQEHCKGLYESALPSAVGLGRAKIEKRIADLGRTTTNGSDLLSMIDPSKDSVSGTWKLEGRNLLGEGEKICRIQIPYIPPEEYDLLVTAERRSGEQSIMFGLARGQTQWGVAIDTWPSEGSKSGLEFLDGQAARSNASTVLGRQFPTGKPVSFEIRVRKSGVKVLIDGRSVISWQGDFSRLSLPDGWKMPESKALFVGFYDKSISYSQILLVPVTGQGKKLR